MIEEAYISFKTAKLLEEKGFKGEYHKYINCANCIVDIPHAVMKDAYIPCPTQAVVMRWLREIYDVQICIACPYCKKRMDLLS